MKHASIVALTLGFSLALPAFAAGRAPDRQDAREETPAAQQAQAQTETRERIYGYELMTPEERLEYQNRMRSLRTQEEREQFRLEHHRLMQDRARAQGKTLPDAPPMHRGPGSGGGMGPGYGR